MVPRAGPARHFSDPGASLPAILKRPSEAKCWLGWWPRLEGDQQGLLINVLREGQR